MYLITSADPGFIGFNDAYFEDPEEIFSFLDACLFKNIRLTGIGTRFITVEADDDFSKKAVAFTIEKEN